MKLHIFRNTLQPGRVYRRSDFWQCKSYPYYLKESLADGTLVKLIDGLYYCPDTSSDDIEIDETQMLQTFLKNTPFLIMPPNVYQPLGIGDMRLWERTVVYNRKRHDVVDLGIGGIYDFRKKSTFPAQVDREFLFVDFINNAGTNTENRAKLLNRIKVAVTNADIHRLKHHMKHYGHSSTRKFFAKILEDDTFERPAILKTSMPNPEAEAHMCDEITQ